MRQQVKFCATFQFRTPLVALEHHGELRDESEARPKYGPSWAGCWESHVPSLNEIMAQAGSKRRFKDFGPTTVASEIGPVDSRGGAFLPFLIDYRRVVEGGLSAPEKVKAIKQLIDDPKHAEIAPHIPPGIVTKFALDALVEALPVGPELASRLFAAGLVDVEAVKAATDEQLGDIDGLGHKRIAAIRAALGQ